MLFDSYKYKKILEKKQYGTEQYRLPVAHFFYLLKTRSVMSGKFVSLYI